MLEPLMLAGVHGGMQNMRSMYALPLGRAVDILKAYRTLPCQVYSHTPGMV